ncbi:MULTISPECIES: PRD domain-containing protein [unclassified Enterococcus]|uniref:BglG family transcription antiterminator LicT n=1 Tax=unclassified Enterococcus TaxID=2608891 RepID=UPI0013ECC049|nr:MULTISPECIES: PRD domain-containing protein [unclassified Enterococcus]
MLIEKVLNNNVVITRDERDREMIVMGKGLAFKKKVGDPILDSCIDKKFQLADDGLSRQFQELAQAIPLEYLEISCEIIEHTKEALQVHLNESVYISLTDHLYTAIERHKMGVFVPNVLLYDIKQLFPKEYAIGKKTVDKISDTYNIMLSEDEAGFIALHLVNAQSIQSQQDNTYLFTTTIQDILNIVRYYYRITFDEDSIHFFRFVTHLRFFLTRVLDGTKPEEEVSEELFQIIQKKYGDTFGCVEKIADFLAGAFDYQMSKDEKMYLTIHTARLVHENRCK